MQDGESTCDSLEGKRIIVTGRETSSVCVSVCTLSLLVSDSCISHLFQCNLGARKDKGEGGEGLSAS